MVKFRPLRQIRDFNHGEGLHVDLRKALLQSGNQVEKILERQIGMQPADNVKLGDRLGVAGSGRLEGFFERHGVSARSIFLAPKSAQPAGRHANIRRIDMAVDVKVRLVAMHPLPHPVGQPAHGQDVARPIKHKRIGLVQPFAREDFILDRKQPRVVGLKWVGLE